MNNTIQTISLTHLMIAFIPVAVILVILFKWSLNTKSAFYAVSRMLGQLLLVGYFLTYIFDSDNAMIILIILMVMLVSSSWIALRMVKTRRRTLFYNAFFAIALGGGTVLFIISQWVLNLDPWYFPRYMVPLAGMIFSNSMNSVSLAAERLYAELNRSVPLAEARKIALQAALIPIVNSLFAVGLVSIPGMMTGQILSGVSPLIAARYQIMVMCMIFGAAGISAACFLGLAGAGVVASKK
ncbi:putative ABC transport system permease protein [Desulfocicer vacuolatum DSM 3385]|uniref:Putative ABC transport system permease protein n=1 Tax=Desulfocicer vacuolatum DSM 3385 TaxID=1121400 RepID=A0A1W2E7C1_9BACT|nr:ABC transporter permease [Desulfocicer vacuolatum]SMD05679.1 putative ABC transport system permease protein [Desulfocicer vacuolatum DSM 3385]